MKPHLSMVTLGVADLERATIFYRGRFGFADRRRFRGRDVFQTQRRGGFSLFPRDELLKDANANAAASTCNAAFTLAHNVASKEEVDTVMQQAEAAGATILKAPQEAFWGGYHGFFADLDGFIWEVAWNPDLDLT